MSNITEFADIPEYSVTGNLTLQGARDLVMDIYTENYKKVYAKAPPLYDSDPLTLTLKSMAMLYYMPIGNLTSQLFANIYMNELDQYAKHVLHIHYYIRYMDDVIVLAETKEQLQEWKEKIEAFLRDELFLDLNDKTCIRPVSMGIEFVGVRIYATHMKLRKSTVGRLKREVKKITEMYATGEMSKEDFDRRVASIKGLLAHTQSASLRGRLNLIYRDTMQKYGRPTGPETDIWKGTYEEKKLARSVRKAA